MNKSNITYKGRFAPSPTGELHFGSLVAAVGSYLQAKSQGGQWLIRIEDVDQTRTVPLSDQHILQTLEDFGFEWDGEIVYQSQRTVLYESYLEQLTANNLIYPCDCSRSKLKQNPENNSKTGVYPGYCRHKVGQVTSPNALRCIINNEHLSFQDQIQGQYETQLDKECGDFIVRRRDGFIAYHLAVVVDDAEQGITNIVRGADLLTSTPQHLYLQQQLGLSQPEYAHLPIAMHDDGHKLSKSHQDLPIHQLPATEILCSTLNFLNQSIPDNLQNSTLEEFWKWAIDNWDISKVSKSRELTFNLP